MIYEQTTRSLSEDISAPGNSSKCLHELFEAQAMRTPDAIALRFEEVELTYRELNERSNQVAHQLIERGVRPEDLVGICVERSLEMIVGVLGVLKAGAAYVPFDPTYPKERLRFLFEDAVVAILLTQRRLIPDLPQHPAQVICLDEQSTGDGQRSNPVTTVGAENLAYVIYTSGSTGRPKGVMVTHANVTRLFTSTENLFNFGPNDVWTLFHSYAFDFSVWEIWGALLYGGRLLIVPYLVSRTPEAFITLLRKENVSIINQTPSAFHQFASAVEDSNWTNLPRSLRLVIFGGETLQLSSLRTWFEHFDDECPQLVNMYGITETTVHATYRRLRRSDVDLPSMIGVPLSDLHIWLLNNDREPVAIGEIGELYVGGAGVARGYLNRPELTKQRFLKDVLNGGNVDRFYRSGDLARLTAEGDLEYMGRCDEQVKIRGHRIELNEIEETLRRHVAVGQCVVVTTGTSPAAQKLMAYVSLRSDHSVTGTELRNHLAQHLPEYMLPAAVTVLKVLPLTRTGKIDRKLLAERQVDRSLKTEYVAPRSVTEEAVVEILRNLLKVDLIGIDDLFFDLGGNSILALQVVSRLREQFRIRLPQHSLFKYPTASSLAFEIERLKALPSSEQQLTIQPQPRGEGIPLSLQQEQVWFIEQLHPSNKSYNSQSVLRLSGELNSSAVIRALSEIVRRHEILRTTFPVVDGRPVQVIHQSRQVDLPVVDLRSLPVDERQLEAERLIAKELDHHFDVDCGPLIRWTLLRLETNEHLLIHIEHHFLHDGWSFNVFVGEFVELYKSLSQGNQSTLSAPELQYADFAIWQRNWLTTEDAKEQLQYWLNKLTDSPSALELPADRSRKNIQSFHGAATRFEIPADLYQAIQALSSSENSTLFTTLFAAFVALLHRYTGQDDICVGSGFGNRNARELEGSIGMFVNTLVLRTDTSGNPSFRDLLERVRKVAFEALAHQSLPFNHVVERLQPDRNLARNPLFQVAFSFHDAPRYSLNVPGLQIGVTEALNNGSAKFDINIIAIPKPLPEDPKAAAKNSMVIIWEYNTDLFDAATIDRMTSHYRLLLESITLNPEQRLSELRLLSTEEQKELLIDYNQTGREYPRDASLSDLFERKAELHPDATALVSGDQSCTYGELNNRANQLASFLAKHGVTQSTNPMIGIMLNRSMDLVVAILAVLKCGAAYVPLDPENPVERSSFITTDTGVQIVLTEACYLEKVEDLNIEAICLGEKANELSRQPDTNLGIAISGRDPAYVMYTSGSTGQPKGICIEQHSVSRLVTNTNYVELTAEDRVAHLSNIAFDASTFEIWGALLNGGAVVLVEKDVALDPHQFAQLLEEQRVTTIFLTTALFNQFSKAIPAAFRSLRYVLVGGEVCDPKSVNEVLKAGAPTSLLNVYGPTETTTFASWYELREPIEPGTTIPIGQPISNTQLYVLDKEMTPVPFGVVGELYIGGEGLAREYLNQPALTAERFVANPFGNSKETRLYRSGDLVRRRSSGDLEFVGRNDGQIKIRGFRIELSEVEFALKRHHSISDAVVVLSDGFDDKRLAAYLVSESEIDVSELRNFLKRILPDYMVPTSFVQLDRLPLNANGKIDRKALPQPVTGEQTAAGNSNVQTPVQELLLNIWSEVLNRTDIGVDDNFFELGGHSLLATQVFSRIRECLSVELPVRALFETPTITGLSSRIESDLSIDTSAAYEPIVFTRRDQELVLSSAQQRLWLLNQLEPNNTAYNIAGGFRLRGKLDLAAFEWSLSRIVERHEALRTTFSVVNDRPVQVIHAASETIPLSYKHCRHLSDDEYENEIKKLLEVEAKRRFDLSRGPLFCAGLISHSDEEHMFVLAMHHIVSDGWSLHILIKEFLSLYEKSLTGQRDSLNALPIQYVDYSAWQKQILEAGAVDKGLAFWKQQLHNLPTLALPTDHVRPPVQTFEGYRLAKPLNQKLTASLKILSRQQGTTLFMTMLAAFDVLLSRYSGQDDIAVGSPIAGRNRRELEGLIGFFVNTLVLRSDLSGDPKFTELLRRVRHITLDAYAHQNVPFERLVEELQQQRDLSRSPLFQVMFTFLNMPPAQMTSSGLNVSEVEAFSDIAKFDLSLTVREVQDQLELGFQYNSDLFERNTILRMMAHFEQLLETVVVNPEQQLSELTLLSDEDRLQQVFEWNATSSDYPRDSTVQGLFEEQARMRPRSIALECGDEKITYQQLNERSNQFAHYLRRRGVDFENESLVAVVLGKSIDFVVSVLGILKAGASYVPLDPDYPAERLRYMLHDSNVAAVVTNSESMPSVTGLHDAVLCIDRDRREIDAERAENIVSNANAKSLAYVMYTSGSTGEPKGICIEHRGIVRLVRNTNYVKLDHEEVLLQFASVSFDASTFEIWGALLNGARLVIPVSGQTSLAELSSMLRDRNITTLWLTAGLFHLMIENHLEDLKGLKQLLAGGDVLSVRQVRQALQQLPGCRVINGYGPTENTTFTSCHIMQNGDEPGATVPIGRPISNTQVYVLNEQMKLVPLGVPGELYTGGDGVGRGYLNQPELTAEKFVKNPFSDEEDARLYRTGDFVRWRPNGVLEFIGRTDTQVKLRGFRIELREIEASLVKHGAVSECVVTLREEAPADQRLFAYCVASNAHTLPTEAELRRYLRQTLPDYMVPSSFVELKQLPLTANGKIDYAELPPPSSLEHIAGREHSTARTQTEELLVNIWADVLNLSNVGTTANFFELGGHSLLATQVISRIRNCFHVELPLRDLFEEPTVVGLSQRIDVARHRNILLKPETLVPVSREEPLPLSFAQQRLWFLDQLEPQNTAYNVWRAVRLGGTLNIETLERSLNDVVRRHEILRTSFPIIHGRPVQSIVEAEQFLVLEVDDLSGIAPEDREAQSQALLAEAGQSHFDLAVGPLLRAKLLVLSDDEHILLLTMHHIVSDGWSLNILLQELGALYQSYVNAAPIRLPDLKIQYGDYSVWQREVLTGEGSDAKLAYWKRQLNNLTAVQLPTSRVRPPVQSFRGQRLTAQLSAPLTKNLRALNQHEGVTLFMTLLAAFDVLLSRYSGQEDITVGSPIAGRDRRELEDLVGFFVNTLVLRTDLAGDPTFKELLQRVRDVTLDAYDNQEVPFERLVEELQPRRDLSRSPLFQIMFSLVNVPELGFQIDGLDVHDLEGLEETAKFDLSLNAKEIGERIEISFQYNTDLFGEGTIKQMMRHYETLLEAIVSEPNRRVSELDLMSAEERHYLEVSFNQPQQEHLVNQNFATLFERQVEQTPNNVAVQCDKKQLTYRELNRRANQLSHFLRRKGVGPEVQVGILVDRSVEMLIALLGVMKAGGSYVPLDPETPVERLMFTTADAGIRALITNRKLSTKLSTDVLLIDLDVEKDFISRESENNLRLQSSPETLAYVLYTSGSTGKPKGVMIEQRALVNLLCGLRNEFKLTQDDVLLAATTLSFDIAGVDLYLPLLSGAKVLIATRRQVVDPQELRELFERTNPTMMQGTPTLFRMLIDSGWQGAENLKILCGGEVVTRELASQLLERCQFLWNGYGPTEATIYASMQRVRADANGALPATIPIGGPVASSELFIVDKHLQLVPRGVPGELFIGGPGVARGYLNRPELTAEGFINLSFGNQPSRRLYRTGDSVRLNESGELEYLGRLDHQIKIRGYRVETGEIEAALAEHEGVQHAAVVLREDVSGQKRLVGYVVPAKRLAKPAGNGNADSNGQHETITIDSWRRHLLQRLPEYMVPGVFVILSALPLTATGKVDRKSLPAPGDQRPALSEAYVAPQNEVEEHIAEIWHEALKVELVGRYDNFFDLGGSSLLMAQVQNRLQETFVRRVPMVELFRYPTINSLAEFLSQNEVANSIPLQALRRADIRRNSGRRSSQSKDIALT